jgi:hypothetical protein
MSYTKQHKLVVSAIILVAHALELSADEGTSYNTLLDEARNLIEGVENCSGSSALRTRIRAVYDMRIAGLHAELERLTKDASC